MTLEAVELRDVAGEIVPTRIEDHRIVFTIGPAFGSGPLPRNAR